MFIEQQVRGKLGGVSMLAVNDAPTKGWSRTESFTKHFPAIMSENKANMQKLKNAFILGGGNGGKPNSSSPFSHEFLTCATKENRYKDNMVHSTPQ